MDELRLSDPDAQRVGRFFADLMLTLAEDGVEGADSADAVRLLWHGMPGQAPTIPLDVGSDTLVHGLGGVAAVLATQLASERRAVGRTGASVGEVWREVGRSLDPAAFFHEKRSSGTGDTV
jgi:hypothetical protein